MSGFGMFNSFGMFGKRVNIIPTSWTTILFSDGNDLTTVLTRFI